MRCYYCGNELNKNNFTVDHIYPKSKGGIGKGNKVSCCKICNRMKQDMLLEEFMETFYYREFCSFHFQSHGKEYLNKLKKQKRI